MAVKKYGDQNGKSRPEKKPATPRFNDFKFINRELSTEEKNRVKAIEFTEADAFAAMEKWAEEYRFSLKWDERSAAYSCFIQPLSPEHGNAGCILSGRGSTLVKAVKQALFKHETLAFEHDWGTLDGSSALDIDD